MNHEMIVNGVAIGGGLLLAAWPARRLPESVIAALALDCLPMSGVVLYLTLKGDG